MPNLPENRKPAQEGASPGDRELSQSLLSQFPKNLVSSILLFLVHLASGLWVTPFLIHSLGVAAFGLVPLANSITRFVTLATMGVSIGLSRFLTIDLQQKDHRRANRTFNTGFWTLAAVIAALVPLLAAFTQYVPVLFEIPADQGASAKILFAGVFGASLLTVLSGCFAASAPACNRLDLRNYTQMTRTLTRIALLLVLFVLFRPSLEGVALATILSALVAFSLYRLLWRKLTPDLKVDLSCFDRTRLRDIAGLAGWHLVNYAGILLILNIDLIVVNRLFGPVKGGEYASVLQWNILIRSMAAVLAGAVHPMILICYAKDRMGDFLRIAKTTVKLMTLGLALPVGFVCGFSPELLSLWIGPHFAGLAPLMVLMLIHLTTNLAEIPLYSVCLCYNRLRFSGIVTVFAGFLNLVLALALPLWLGTGFYGVALAGAVALTLKCSLFAPWYAAQVMNVPKKTFFSEMAKGVPAVIAVILAAFAVKHVWAVDSWTRLLLLGAGIAAAYGAAVWRTALSPQERALIVKMLRRQ